MHIKPHVPVQCVGSEAQMSACRAAQVVSQAPESCAWVTAALMTGHSGPPAPEKRKEGSESFYQKLILMYRDS